MRRRSDLAVPNSRFSDSLLSSPLPYRRAGDCQVAASPHWILSWVICILSPDLPAATVESVVKFKPELPDPERVLWLPLMTAVHQWTGISIFEQAVTNKSVHPAAKSTMRPHRLAEKMLRITLNNRLIREEQLAQYSGRVALLAFACWTAVCGLGQQVPPISA